MRRSVVGKNEKTSRQTRAQIVDVEAREFEKIFAVGDDIVLEHAREGFVTLQHPLAPVPFAQTLAAGDLGVDEPHHPDRPRRHEMPDENLSEVHELLEERLSGSALLLVGAVDFVDHHLERGPKEPLLVAEAVIDERARAARDVRDVAQGRRVVALFGEDLDRFRENAAASLEAAAGEGLVVVRHVRSVG